MSRVRCFGVASLKEIMLSSRFSRFFFSVCRGPGRTFYAEAIGFFLNAFVLTRAKSFRARSDRRTRGLIVQGLFIGSGRSRSCLRDYTLTHPFVYPLA